MARKRLMNDQFAKRLDLMRNLSGGYFPGLLFVQCLLKQLGWKT